MQMVILRFTVNGIAKRLTTLYTYWKMSN